VAGAVHESCVGLTCVAGTLTSPRRHLRLDEKTKPLPTTASIVPPLSELDVGATEVTVASATNANLVPSLVKSALLSVTSTPTTPATCAGARHSSLVALIQRAATDLLAPKRQYNASESTKLKP